MSIIILTGASGDIGTAIIEKLTPLGHEVIGVVRSPQTAAVLSENYRIKTIIADLESVSSILNLGNELSTKVDWLVTAHGFIDECLDPFELTYEALERTFRVNTFSQFSLAQVFSPHLTHGMIMISSTAGVHANGRVAAYSASKAAVNSLTQSFARNRPETTFIAVCPGPTRGKMRARIGAEGGQPPSDVAKLISEIIADKTPYQSGDIITIKDGFSEIVSRIN